MFQHGVAGRRRDREGRRGAGADPVSGYANAVGLFCLPVRARFTRRGYIFSRLVSPSGGGS